MKTLLKLMGLILIVVILIGAYFWKYIVLIGVLLFLRRLLSGSKSDRRLRKQAKRDSKYYRYREYYDRRNY